MIGCRVSLASSSARGRLNAKVTSTRQATLPFSLLISSQGNTQTQTTLRTENHFEAAPTPLCSVSKGPSMDNPELNATLLPSAYHPSNFRRVNSGAWAVPACPSGRVSKALFPGSSRRSSFFGGRVVDFSVCIPPVAGAPRLEKDTTYRTLGMWAASRKAFEVQGLRPW